MNSSFAKIEKYLNCKDYYFHASSVQGLKVLKPKESSHGKSYVYATISVASALLFGSHGHRDLDGIYGGTAIPYFIEGYKGAFAERFDGKRCSLYIVKKDNFQALTSWKAERVSTVEVAVEAEIQIDDLASVILELNRRELFVIKTYDDKDADLQKLLKCRMKNIFLNYGYLYMEQDEKLDFILNHYRAWFEECKNEFMTTDMYMQKHMKDEYNKIYNE